MSKTEYMCVGGPLAVLILEDGRIARCREQKYLGIKMKVGGTKHKAIRDKNTQKQ